MAYHHLAMAATDMTAIHHFYETVLGFELAKVEVAPVPEGGWAKHFFYRMSPDDTAFIAFWEMHDVPGADKVETSLSKAAGVPDQINHFAFQATDREDLQRRCKDWQAAGLSVLEIDHNWCHSIYTKDPNGNLVEFCTTTGKLTAEDRQSALRALETDQIAFSPDPAGMVLHKPTTDS